MYFSVHLTVISWVLLKEHYGFFLLSLFNFQGPMRFFEVLNLHFRECRSSVARLLLYIIQIVLSRLFWNFFKFSWPTGWCIFALISWARLCIITPFFLFVNTLFQKIFKKLWLTFCRYIYIIESMTNKSPSKTVTGTRYMPKAKRADGWCKSVRRYICIAHPWVPFVNG